MTTELKRPCAGMPRPRKCTKRGFTFGVRAREMFPPDAPPIQKTILLRQWLRRTSERKQNMTKTEIGEARTNLVRTIIAIKKLKTQKTALTKALEPDFEAHEAEYRNGVKTDAGVLVRKPKWNFDAKPVVEVAG